MCNKRVTFYNIKNVIFLLMHSPYNAYSVNQKKESLPG